MYTQISQGWPGKFLKIILITNTLLVIFGKKMRLQVKKFLKIQLGICDVLTKYFHEKRIPKLYEIVLSGPYYCDLPTTCFHEKQVPNFPEF